MNKILITLGRDRTADYAVAVKAAGGDAGVVDPTTTPADYRKAFAQSSALLLTGGGDVACELYGAQLSAADKKEFIRGVDKERDELEIELARKAVAADMPVFAICRGVQVLNVALGGTLIHDVPTQVGKEINHAARMVDLAHEAAWENSSRLVRELGRDFPRVNSSHHQALQKVAPSLKVIARAPDGVIEAVENPDAKFLVGVQFHPERLVKEHPEFLELFRRFLASI